MALVPSQQPQQQPVQRNSESQVLMNYHGSKALQEAGVQRSSELLAPTLLLEGHKGPVHSLEFSPDGNLLASGSFDKTVALWYIWGECVNSHLFTGHKNAVLDVHWSPDSQTVYSCSADSSGMIWDVESGERVKKLTGHASIVNSICPARRGPPLLVTGSDDCTAKVWDERVKGPTSTLKTKYQLTSVSFSDGADQVFLAGIDPAVACYDLRKPDLPLYGMEGHTDTVTSISLSPNGHELLSNGMDNSVRIWDVRPFSSNRATKSISGVQHGIEKNLLKCRWSADGRMVSAGSSNRFVMIWSSLNGRLLHQLPGHNGAVWDIAFHPSQPIIASGSSDQTIYLGELN
eukprot:CAMPEP_0201477790 /NCGR_PEP_ID=MMETSP0151_2-20130828/2753_1 /ASSEMBLY_ACC=CAM_ASM_000257 /TAXON_ID=200890 /ORGANISM="Paramoeba atlantica, Strain 621/1 / CCAP 1560/9" /LENGTH=345 /DNA_ID=CAMNT_0047858629 /DNA_START=60 /DNA_END=1097 /DNA_ORIENTATION=-